METGRHVSTRRMYGRMGAREGQGDDVAQTARERERETEKEKEDKGTLFLSLSTGKGTKAEAAAAVAAVATARRENLSGTRKGAFIT